MTGRYTSRLSATDWVLLGWLAACLLLPLMDRLNPANDGGGEWTEQDVTLSEDHLKRLEAGETVVVPRWHGCDLRLDATVVVPVDGGEDADAE